MQLTAASMRCYTLMLSGWPKFVDFLKQRLPRFYPESFVFAPSWWEEKKKQKKKKTKKKKGLLLLIVARSVKRSNDQDDEREAVTTLLHIYL